MGKEEIAFGPSIVALDAPKGSENGAVDPIGFFDIAQGLLMRLHHLLAVGDAGIIDQEGHIVPDREAIFRLRAREAHRLLIECDVAEGGIDDIGPDAGLEDIGANALHASLERSCGNGTDEDACRHDDGPDSDRQRNRAYHEADPNSLCDALTATKLIRLYLRQLFGQYAPCAHDNAKKRDGHGT